MPNNGVYTIVDDFGFPVQAAKTFPVTLGANSGLQAVRSSRGRVVTVVVTTATASAATTIYDNPSAASGTPLLVIPASTPAGTVYSVNMPAVTGITVSSPGATGAITLGYS